MNAQSIVQELPNLNRSERAIFAHLAKLYDENTPTVLYLDYYELANGTPNYRPNEKTNSDNFPGFPGTTPEQWESFLDIPELFRYSRSKIAKLQEYAAVKALKRLEGDFTTSGLKELAKLSKSMQGGNQREKIILTYVKPKQYPGQTQEVAQ